MGADYVDERRAALTFIGAVALLAIVVMVSFSTYQDHLTQRACIAAKGAPVCKVTWGRLSCEGCVFLDPPPCEDSNK